MSETEPEIVALAGKLEGEILVHARCETVFAAISDPKQLIEWWGSSDTYRLDEWIMPLKVGAHWSCHGAGRGGKFSIEGKVLEVKPPRLLSYTWKASWIAMPEIVFTWRLTPVGRTSTRVQVTHSGYGDNSAALNDHKMGLPSVLRWLADYARNKDMGRT